jgi:hypothetical protein
MSEQRDAPRVYGMRIGLVSGLFAIAQVLVSVAAARGSEASLLAVQRTFAVLTGGGLADPTTIAPALIPMLITTYLSLLVVGLLTVWFASRAGRLAAIAQGRHAGGASAGMWVWLTTTGIWLLASIVATVITNSDGTISGVFFGTFSSAYLPQQLIFLLLQEVVAALVCLGFCAIAGAYGARNAPVSAVAQAPLRAPAWYPYAPYPPYPPQGAYPYAPYPTPGAPVSPAPSAHPGQQPYPGYPGYPPTGWGTTPGTSYPGGMMTPPQQGPRAPQATAPMPYPPPPSFYVPQPPAQAESPAPPAAQPE